MSGHACGPVCQVYGVDVGNILLKVGISCSSWSQKFPPSPEPIYAPSMSMSSSEIGSSRASASIPPMRAGKRRLKERTILVARLHNAGCLLGPVGHQPDSWPRGQETVVM